MSHNKVIKSSYHYFQSLKALNMLKLHDLLRLVRDMQREP